MGSDFRNQGAYRRYGNFPNSNAYGYGSQNSYQQGHYGYQNQVLVTIILKWEAKVNFGGISTLIMLITKGMWGEMLVNIVLMLQTTPLSVLTCKDLM